jgi:hypothetical protein
MSSSVVAPTHVAATSIDGHNSSSINATCTSSTVVKVYNSLNQGCLSYAKSWAWQQVLLSRRLEYKRNQKQQQQEEEEIQKYSYNEDHDCILMLEHSPVYTLGRGADETHLKFLQQQSNTVVDCTNKSQQQQQQQLSDDEIRNIREKLSRKARGYGTARLSVDKRIEDQIIVNGLFSIEDAIEQLSNLACPVNAPNGVPIFRVERGGKYHSIFVVFERRK